MLNKRFKVTANSHSAFLIFSGWSFRFDEPVQGSCAANDFL